MYNKLIVVALVVLCLAGCQYFNPITPIVQLGIYWKEGEAIKYYAADQETLYAATKKALEKYKLPITSEDVKDRTKYIKAGDDDKFKIKVVAVRDNVSKLCIRVNTFGDKPYAELIYTHIDNDPTVPKFANLQELQTKMETQRRPWRR